MACGRALTQRCLVCVDARCAPSVDEDGQGGHVAHPGAAQEGEINLDLDEEVYQQAPLSPQLLPLSIVEDDPRIKLVDPLEDWQALVRGGQAGNGKTSARADWRVPWRLHARCRWCGVQCSWRSAKRCRRTSWR